MTTRTEEYDQPGSTRGSLAQPALVVAFPSSTAFELPRAGFAVGRDWLGSGGIVDSKTSREHVAFSRPGGVLHVEDVGSRNGTWLDGEPLREGARAPVRDGAVLRLGRTVLVYREQLEGELEPAPAIGPLVGPYGLRGVAARLDAFSARPPSNVLIEGETGAGKELVAGALAARLRPGKPYVAVNVAAMTAGVFEAQLFGYVAGAYSGSGRGAAGIFADNNGGVVFLDELGELSLEMQPKLLRLLENREVLPVGASRPSVVDVLVVAATNRSIETMVETGGFRRDLHARFAAAHLEIPPLRERCEDLFAIIQALSGHRGATLDPANVDVEAIEALMLQPWPSNVRELAAVLDRAVTQGPPASLRWSVLRGMLGERQISRPAPLSVDRVTSVLDACRGNQSEAARKLGVSRGHLLRFLRAAGRAS